MRLLVAQTLNPSMNLLPCDSAASRPVAQRFMSSKRRGSHRPDLAVWYQATGRFLSCCLLASVAIVGSVSCADEEDLGKARTFCSSYPETNGLVTEGNVVRNYAWVDRTGASRMFCDLARGGNRLAFVAYGSVTCLTCQHEALGLADLQREYGARGVVAVQLLVDVDSVSQLQGWPGANLDYELGFVRPNPEQVMDDCQEAPDCEFAHVLPHHFIVDLKTMKVVAPDCHRYTKDEWVGCLAPFL